MRFFLDNNLSPYWAPALQILEKGDHQVVHLREKFPRRENGDWPDVEWITALATEGNWIIISGDVNITKRKHERQVWRDSKLTAFFLHPSWSNYNFREKTWRFIRWWPRIIEQADGIQPGAGFIVPVNFGSSGKFQQFSG